MDHIPDESALGAAVAGATDVAFVDAGGFKAVFRARLHGNEQALKAVYVPRDDETEEGTRAQLLARLKREIQVLAECAHPGLVKLGVLRPEHVTIAGNEYIVYSEELIPGTSLKSALGSGVRPDLRELVSLALTLVGVVEDIWEAGYVHRDIKPGNVIRTGEPARPFVVLDLGIAFKMYGTQLTAEGRTLGTRLYMPPELFAPNYKQVIDFRSDLYSAGVTLYEYASGLHPLVHRPEDEMTTVYRILRQRPEPLSALRHDLPVPFCRVVDRCMRKKPALRFSDLAELAHDLEAMR